ncbi:MAG: lysylphosphatidylglycerol synthase transmembrane domain-containing protein [Candidatus Aenigmarchaeota archaeon]|nr:lysylphosphatidylglycerol synthase transmembrane domain-containing protein [Candidatus Aenigmarchaeota archaeon]MDI6722576.1 lysylphosphatidylglycerol synthase transmembrane domain-containing protein [Candidatus Aenigmarchaeota archaeon]
MNKLKILPFIISIIIISAIIYFSNPYQIFLSVMRVNKFYIFIAFMFSFLNIFLRVLKWKVILENVRLMELLPVQIFGMVLSNFTPGKVAEPAKSILLRVRKGIPVSVTLPTIVWERINDIVVMLILSFIALQTLGIESNIFFVSIISMAVFSLLAIILLVALHNRKFGNRIFAFIRKFPLAKNISHEFIESFYSIKTKKMRIVKSFMITLLAWVIEGVIFYFVLFSMNVSSNFLVLAGIVSLSIIIGVASSLPGGIGSSELAMILLLGLTGIPAEIAVSSVFIYRIMSFWFGSLVGGLSFVYLSKKIDMKEFRLK